MICLLIDRLRFLLICLLNEELIENIIDFKFFLGLENKIIIMFFFYIFLLNLMEVLNLFIFGLILLEKCLFYSLLFCVIIMKYLVR